MYTSYAIIQIMFLIPILAVPLFLIELLAYGCFISFNPKLKNKETFKKRLRKFVLFLLVLKIPAYLSGGIFLDLGNLINPVKIENLFFTIFDSLLGNMAIILIFTLIGLVFLLKYELKQKKYDLYSGIVLQIISAFYFGINGAIQMAAGMGV